MLVQIEACQVPTTCLFIFAYVDIDQVSSYVCVININQLAYCPNKIRFSEHGAFFPTKQSLS